MALAHDVTTRFPSGADTVTDTTSGDRTFDHAAAAGAVGVVVILWHGDATADGVTGIDYGGVALVKAVTASDTSETNRVTVWTSHQKVIPGGTQTVTLQGCSTTAKVASVNTVTAATNAIAVNASNAVDTTTSSNPTVTVNTATNNTLLYGAVGGGAAAPTSYAAGTNYTALTGACDYGAKSGRGQVCNAPVAPGAIVFNFTYVTSDDWCIAAAAIEEYTSGDKVGSDSGSGSDASALVAAIPITDSGSSTEDPTLLAITATSDSGTSAETTSLEQAHAVSDVGTGADSTAVSGGDDKTDTDSGAGFDLAWNNNVTPGNLVITRVGG